MSARRRMVSCAVDRAYSEQRLNIAILVRRTPERMIHHECPWISQTLMPDKICRPQSRTVIGRSRLNVNFLERRSRANLTIRNTVHSAASGQAQMFRFFPFPQHVEDMKNAGLVVGLQRVRDILMEFRQRFVRTAGWAKQAL